jgi:hypothetical protein
VVIHGELESSLRFFHPRCFFSFVYFQFPE